MSRDQQLASLADFIERHTRVLVLTGAGCLEAI